MADQFVQVQPDSSGKKVDVTELTVGANTVERQRIVMAGAGAADLAPVDSVAGLMVQLGDVAIALRQLLNQLNRPISMDPGTGRVRVVVDAITAALTLGTITTVGTVTTVTTVSTVTTVTTVTTVSTLTSMTQMRGFDLKDTLLNAMERMNWADNVRRQIT